jgi:hypothetical protein
MVTGGFAWRVLGVMTMDGYKSVSVSIEGVAPLIVSNGQMADPLNEWAQALKEISGKRKKSDDDLEEMGRLEFMGRLYVDGKRQPCIPSVNLEALIVAGAKKTKEGMIAKSGVLVDGQYWPLIYSGPKDPDKLWLAKNFVSRVRVSMTSGASVMRTRPQFPEWSLSFDVLYTPDLVNSRQLRGWIETAGRQVGMCDWTPRHGRYLVTKFEEA